ncbi:DUF6366 family protein [Paenibacillus sp. CAU 1782]
MSHRNEKPEETRERMRQQELRNNPMGAFGDGVNRASHGSLTDLVGGLGWKGTGILVLLLVLGFIGYRLFV